MRKKKRLMISAALSVVILGIPQAAFAQSYTYSLESQPVQAPEAASVDTVIEAASAVWGDTGLNVPSDLAAAPNGDLYIADTGNNRILILDSSLRRKGQITEALLPDDTKVSLSAPYGVFVDGNGLLYIADKGNHQVLACDADGTAVKVLTVTGEEVFDQRFTFQPVKVTADDLGNTYVISEGSYDGLLQFDSEGEFVGFLGANKVAVDPWQWIWKKISTQIQRKKMVKSLPVEFDNLDVDERGFVYTVTANTTSTPVRRQNALGQDILKSSAVYGRPVGDKQYADGNAVTLSGPSSLADVSAQPWGYLCLDERRGRVFAYGDTGDILFIIGGYGAEAGKFLLPVAVDMYEDRIFVLDERTSSLTVFSLTDYGKLILDARQRYMDGDYEGSEESWNQVLRYQSQLPVAHIGIGKVYYMRGQYAQAMKYAKMGGDKNTYSDAYAKYQQELITRAFGWLIAGLAALSVVLLIWYLYRRRHPKKKKKKELPDWANGLAYAWYIARHPFDGFWDMTHENRGKMSSACILYAAWILVSIFDAGGTGFLFKALNSQFRLFDVLGVSILPVLLWCVCNWAVSTLMDGDGKPSAIAMSTAYALAPYIVSQFAAVCLSNVLTLDQGMILTVVAGIGTVWCLILLLASVITVHNYTLTRSVEVIILILAAMAIVLFLSVLLLNLVDQMRFFLWNLYREIIVNM